jgi:hypothetical protein
MVGWAGNVPNACGLPPWPDRISVRLEIEGLPPWIEKQTGEGK